MPSAGPALTIETVESFLGNGLKVNHLIEVDFEDFPELIDSLGGITVNNKTRICSPPFDNFWRGLTLPQGRRSTSTAGVPSGFARVRKNPCAPAEDDRDRAARQQEVLRALGAQATVAEHVLSPALGELEGAEGAQDRHAGPRH